MLSCSAVKLSSCVCSGRKKKKPPVDTLFREPCISSQDHSICPVTSQGAVCPQTQAISVRNGHGDCAAHLWTTDCTSTVERTDVVVSIASCLFFFCFCFIHSVLFFLRKGRDRSTIHVSCADLSVCISQSLVQPFNQTTVLLC